LWDQRGFKQTVIRDYGRWLALARPAWNLAARVTRRPKLPPPRQTLSNAFVSHLAVDEGGDPNLVIDLFSELCAIAAERGVDNLTAGFAETDPRLDLVRRQFRSREYHSRLYLVRWPELGGALQEFDGRILAPEVALL